MTILRISLLAAVVALSACAGAQLKGTAETPDHVCRGCGSQR